MTEKQLKAHLLKKPEIIRILNDEVKETFEGITLKVLNVFVVTEENVALKQNIQYYVDTEENKAYYSKIEPYKVVEKLDK